MSGVLLFSSASAPAIETHVFSSSFGSTGSGAGQISSPVDLAVNPVTHDVYVADSGNFRIDEFTSTGAFIRAWGWGVADGLPHLETCTLVCQAGISGSGPGQFTQSAFIAIDNSGGPSEGDVYVGDTGDNRVSKFDENGNLISSWGVEGQLDGSTATHGPINPLLGIAVGSAGNLDVLERNNTMFEFSEDGAFSTEFELLTGQGSAPFGLALDSTGDIFRIAGTHAAQEFTSTTHYEVGELSLLSADTGNGLAVDPSGDGLYFYDRGEVQHYVFAGPGVAGVGEIKEADGSICKFEPESGGCSATDSFGSGTLPLSYGIAKGMAVDSGRVYVVGEDQVEIFTPATLADTTTEAPAPVGKTSASLHGTVDPVGIEVTSCEFEWGTEEGEYPNVIPCSSLPGSGNAPVSVSAELTGLKSETSYFYRLAAGNAQGVNQGAQKSFATPPAVDALSTGPAEGVTSTGAMLTGSLSPDGADTHYYFEYGTTQKYGSVSPVPPGVDAGSANGGVNAESSVSGLSANTLYHYRLVGVNSFGTTLGTDREFTTAGRPTILSESAVVNPSEKAGQTEAKLQATVNPDGRETAYQFEYGETPAYGSRVPVPPGTLGSGEQAVSVPAGELSGLKVGTTYHYRVVASNEYGTVDGADGTFTTLPPALVSDESATDVTAVSATLGAQINPLGSETTAYFQYGTADCASSPGSCTDLPLAPGSDVGAAESGQSFAVHLQGLASRTTYRYRVVATNAIGTVEGPEQAFTTQAAGGEFTLPDGRSWEMVSPPNKHGSDINALGAEQGSDIQAAASGNAMTYAGTAPFVANPAGSTAIEFAQALSTRKKPGEWATEDITTADNEGGVSIRVGLIAEYKLFSSDLSVGFVEPNNGTPLATGGGPSVAYVRKANGEYEGLTPGGVGHFVYATPDGSHVVLTSHAQLTAAPIAPGGAMYEWSAGRLELASVLPNGEAASGGPGGGGSVLERTISDDGTRLVWSGAGRLYMRDMARRETVQVDAAQGISEPAHTEYAYRAADSKDSRIFFTSDNRLTADSTASSVENHEAEDLYEFEITSGPGEPLAGKLADLTVDGNAGESAGVMGVVGASEDGSYVAFFAAGVLGDAAAHGATPGFNLYVDHYDAAAKAWAPPTFVASLSAGDKPDRDESGGHGSGGKTSRISPNGNYLAFMSERSLTGYDNRDANSGAADEEVFLYDTSTGRIVCASCDPTGARPVGLREGSAYQEHLVDYATNWHGRWVAANVPGWTTTDLLHSLFQSRYLSSSGRMFFDSSDALVPADVDGQEDVYEYEPAGVGSCQPPTYGQSASVVFDEGAGGCIGLVSAGDSSEESAFMEASETGGDVFFLTLSRLVPQDYDNSLDIYDAHECTSSAPCAPAPPLTPPPCTTGDACKPAPTPQPTLFGSPSSETFTGAGNVAPSAPGQQVVAPKQVTRSERLAKALTACRHKPKRRRAACERQAKRSFGAKNSRVHKSSPAGTGR